MTRAEALALAVELGHQCDPDFNTGTVQVDDWKPAMTVNEFMAFATGLSERRPRTGEGEPYVISQILTELRGYAEAYSGRAGTQSAIGWTCASAADAIEGFQEQIALRNQSDSHQKCDAEIAALRIVLIKARDTFADFERVNTALGKDLQAKAAKVALDACNEVLVGS